MKTIKLSFLLISIITVFQTSEFEKLKQQYAYKFTVNTKSTIVDLSPDFTFVKHQGTRNTCSAFASTALAEFVIKKDLNKTYDLSEAFTYYNAKNKALSNSFLKQSYYPVDGLAGYLAVNGFKFGCMEESQWKYNGSADWKKTNGANCKSKNGVSNMECFTGVPPENAKPLDIKLKTVHIPLEKVDDFILSEKRPVVVNIWIYKNGIDMKTGVLSIPEKPELMGGHVVLLTGYNKKTETFVFRNSWGKEWGNNGYGTMPKKYLLEHFEANNFIKQISSLTPVQQEYATKVAMGTSAYVVK